MGSGFQEPLDAYIRERGVQLFGDIGCNSEYDLNQDGVLELYDLVII
jgi:hypothetical protein